MVQERKLKLDIEVDGGVNLSNVETLMDAGANIIVAEAQFLAEMRKRTPDVS